MLCISYSCLFVFDEVPWAGRCDMKIVQHNKYTTIKEHQHNIPMTVPPIYAFPPLYTRQPNAIIRNKQIDSWEEILLSTARQHGLWEIDTEGKFTTSTTTEKSATPPPHLQGSMFTNEAIGRTVPPLFVKEIMSHMLAKGSLVQGGSDSTAAYWVLWKNMDSWASLMLEWCETTGKLGQVVTLYELTMGDESIGWDFHGTPQGLAARCLRLLVKRARATMLQDEYDRDIAVKVI